jgi:hypothetical protein
VQDSTAAATFSTTAWGAAFRRTITDPINIQPLGRAHEAAETQDAMQKRGELGLTSKIFTIHVFPGNVEYNHRRAIGLKMTHGSWPNNHDQETFMSISLKKTIPPGALAPGLRDWETGNQLSGDSTGLEGEGAEGLLHNRHADAHKLRRLQRKEARESIPEVMTSLLAVAAAAPLQEPAAETPKPEEPLWSQSRPNDIKPKKDRVGSDEFYKAFHSD